LPEFGGQINSLRGVSYKVHEGFLRVCFSSKDEWLWEALGVATIEMFQKALSCFPVQQCSTEMYQKKLKELKALDGWDGGYELLNPFLDTALFIERGKDEQDIIELLKDSGLVLGQITNVNFKPHPYCIGDRHLKHSDGIISASSIENMEKYHKVKCGVKGCNLKYAEHTNDRVAFLKVNDPKQVDDIVNLTPAQAGLLHSDVFKAILKEHDIDGIAFIK
jgi:hypothetical protein